MTGVLVKATTGPARFLVALALALPTLPAASTCDAVISTLPWGRLLTSTPVTLQAPAVHTGLGLMAMLPMATVTFAVFSLHVPLAL